MAKIDEARRARYRQEVENSSSNSFVKIPYFKFETSAKVRVLPGIDPSRPEGDFYVKQLAHYKLNPNLPNIPVVCPKTKNPKAKCPGCNKHAELKSSTNPADKAAAEQIRAKARYPMCVVPRTGPDAGKVMVYTAPKSIVDKILGLIDNPEYDDVNNAMEGTDLTFTKTGKGMDTEYDVIASRRSTPISEDEDEVADLLSNQFELWRFQEAPTADEIEAFMNGELQRFTTGGFATMNAAATAKPVQQDTEPEEAPVPVILKKKVTSPAPVDEDEDDVPAPPKKKSNLAAIRKQLDEED